MRDDLVLEAVENEGGAGGGRHLFLLQKKPKQEGKMHHTVAISYLTTRKLERGVPYCRHQSITQTCTHMSGCIVLDKKISSSGNLGKLVYSSTAVVPGCTAASESTPTKHNRQQPRVRSRQNCPDFQPLRYEKRTKIYKQKNNALLWMFGKRKHLISTRFGPCCPTG